METYCEKSTRLTVFSPIFVADTEIIFQNNLGALLTLFREGIFVVPHGWGAKKTPSLKSVTHVLQ